MKYSQCKLGVYKSNPHTLGHKFGKWRSVSYDNVDVNTSKIRVLNKAIRDVHRIDGRIRLSSSAMQT